MTRQEVLSLLDELMGVYPTAKIQNPEATVRIWLVFFGEYDAQDVIKAAKYHISHSCFFPTIADIKKAMEKSQFLSMDSPRLTAGESQEEELDEEEWNEILRALDFIP